MNRVQILEMTDGELLNRVLEESFDAEFTESACAEALADELMRRAEEPEADE